MGGKYEGYNVSLLGRVGEREIYALSPVEGGAGGAWITIEREAGDVSLSEIVSASEMVSAHSAWLRYLMDRNTDEMLGGGEGV